MLNKYPVFDMSNKEEKIGENVYGQMDKIVSSHNLSSSSAIVVLLGADDFANERTHIINSQQLSQLILSPFLRTLSC